MDLLLEDFKQSSEWADMDLHCVPSIHYTGGGRR